MTGEGRRRRPGGSRRASLVLGTWASAVFVVLWAGAVIGVSGDGALFADAWSWIWSLGTIAAVVVWVLLLPLCVGLWATQAALPTLAMVGVITVLVVWTAVAWVGLARALIARDPG